MNFVYERVSIGIFFCLDTVGNVSSFIYFFVSEIFVSYHRAVMSKPSRQEPQIGNFFRISHRF